MLVLTVLNYNGSTTDALSANFDERGGVIGRAETSHLVLPDAERSVSRKHAQISFRNGQYLIVDHGSNPISINGRELGKGHEQVITPGDTVQVGGYLLSVNARQATSMSTTDDPFADLFDNKTIARPSGLPKAAHSASQSAQQPAATPRNTLIPDDWDPFGSAAATPGFDPLASHNAPAAAATPSIAAQLVSSSEDSLENLFGLSNAPLRDPLAASALAERPAQPNTAGDTDPLRALQKPALPSQPPIPDDFPDLRTPWEERVSAPAPTSTPMPAPATTPLGAVLSWEQSTSPASTPQASPFDAGVRETATAPIRPPAATAPAPAPVRLANPDAPARNDEVEALMDAFLEGLDVPSLRIGGLTPSLMFRCGALLRTSTRGTVDLLAARTALKREVRAEVTMIVARENNPLKFSPTVETALQHLLGPLEKGFTPPIAAVQDAFDDLRAHQIGVVAGMRAALEGVLARFDPEQLEAQLVPRTGLAGLLPANRQARLWASFEALHTQLASEAEDAFHELFGRAFLQAYEAHIDQLRHDAKNHAKSE